MLFLFHSVICLTKIVVFVCVQVSDDDPRQSKQAEELDGMAGALAKALAQRSAHIQLSGIYS